MESAHKEEAMEMTRKYAGLTGRTWLAAFVLFVVVAMLSAMTADRASVLAQGTSANGGMSYAKSLSQTFRSVANKTLPAVVVIRTTTVGEQATDDDETPDDADPSFGLSPNVPPEFRRFFEFHGTPRRSAPFRQEGMGSGVIIDPSGIVLTNEHVVDGATKVVVKLHDGREFEATDIKRDAGSDLAILRIKGAGTLTAAKLGNSNDVQVGDWVLALGGPFGLEGTVTAGIISATDRSMASTRAKFLQTDAAINPGNSGGPLVSLDGEVVGINRAIATNSGGYQGVGFAIASNTAKRVSQQLVAAGKVQHSYLGVLMQPLDADLAKQLGVSGTRGALVAEVVADSPAAAAGVRPGDVVLEFAGKGVANPDELTQAVDQTPVGKKEPVTVVRNGNQLTLQVTTGELPPDLGLAGRSLVPGKSRTHGDKKLGVEVANLSPQVAERLGVKAGEGVVVTEVRNGSPADMVGLATGMVIVRVGQTPVKSVDEFRAAMEKQSLAKGVMLLVRTAQGTRFVVIRSS
jgi:serine protease Do